MANPGGVNLETGKNRGERGWGGWRGEREDERAMPPPLREGCAPRALTGGGARGEGEALRLKRVGAGVAAERPPRARALAPVGEEVEGESTAGQEAGEWRSRTSLKTCRNGVGWLGLGLDFAGKSTTSVLSLLVCRWLAFHVAQNITDAGHHTDQALQPTTPHVLLNGALRA